MCWFLIYPGGRASTVAWARGFRGAAVMQERLRLVVLVARAFRYACPLATMITRRGWMEGTMEAGDHDDSDDDHDDDDDGANNDDDNMYFDVPCVSHKIAILGQPHRGAKPLCRPQLAKQASRDIALLHPRPRASCA